MKLKLTQGTEIKSNVHIGTEIKSNAHIGTEIKSNAHIGTEIKINGLDYKTPMENREQVRRYNFN